MTNSALERAIVVAVGSELLGTDRTDTNSLAITAALNEVGVEVVAKAVVGDNIEDLAIVCRDALARADVLVLTGGLGPTDDDVTREAVARVLGRAMHEDPATVEWIRARFARRGWTMPESNRRQAQVIEGATLLRNLQGTAPGQWLEADGKIVALLPGPPREMRPLFASLVETVIAPRTRGERLLRRSVRLAGRSESRFDEMLQPLYAAWAAQQPPIAATILAASGTIELQLRVRSRDVGEGEAMLARAVEQVADVFGPDVISLTGEIVEVAVGRLLRERGMRVALAESCTGGLIASRLTDVPGSSDYVERGIVAYSNEAKVDLLGVPASLIAAHGAVSEPVATAMARGARQIAPVELGVGVTGIAGPGGGSEAKPVGTVAIAISGPDDRDWVRTFTLPGSREMVKTFAATTALDSLRRAVLGLLRERQ